MSISEIQVGSLIRVKIGRNLIYAKVLEVLNDGFRVCSVAKNKEFHVTPSRIAFDEGEAEQSAPANAEPQNETEQEAAEPEANEQEPAEPEVAAQTESESVEEQAGTGEEAEAPETVEQNADAEQTEADEAATVEVVPEDEAAEFIPSGEDEEDEYVINPAHESDQPVKRMSLLSAAVEVLKEAGPEHPMNCKEILEAILERKLWTPTDCKTPEQTLYGSIFREINTKDHPRIVKSDIKGKFRIAR